MADTWDPEDWKGFRDWGDEVRIELRFVEDPSGTTVIEDWIVLPMGRAVWSQDWLLQRVEALGRRDGGEPTYVLRLRDNKYVWGGDASSYQIILDVWVGVLGGAAWDGLRALASDLASRLRSGEQGVPARPMTDAEAETRARWVLSERYSVSESDLKLSTIEHTDDQASSEFVGPDGTRYVIELTMEDGLVLIAKVRRTPPT